VVHSYTMLTINADEHPLMRLFHKPADEKRMVAILPSDRYQDWLEVSAEHSKEFMRAYRGWQLPHLKARFQFERHDLVR
jgi:putative SOS response-associated peptidase YedK